MDSLPSYRDKDGLVTLIQHKAIFVRRFLVYLTVREMPFSVVVVKVGDHITCRSAYKIRRVVVVARIQVEHEPLV